MPRLGRNRTDPEPWIEQLVLSYGTATLSDRAVKATVIGARDLTESQDETDASCVIFLSDGVVFIPAVLTTQAWSRLQDMEERESYSGLENAIVCVKNLQLNFHMEPELASCQFYVTVNQISTVGQGSFHEAVPNCATLLSVKEQIHKLWRSRVEESSSQSQYGFRLTDLLEEWEREGGTQISPSEVIDRPAQLSQPITSHHSMNLPTHYTMNTPPGPSTATYNESPPSEALPSHCMVDFSAEPSSSYYNVAPLTHCQATQSTEDGVASEEIQLLKKVMERLVPPTVSDADVTTPTQWHQDRLSYKADECFSVPVSYLLIPEDQRKKMITMATTASTTSSTTIGSAPPPLADRQTVQPITTQTEGLDQLPSSGDRMDDSPHSSVLLDAESVREGGAWDIFAPAVIDMLKSPSSSELSATPEDLPLLHSQSASVLPENLPFLQSQSDPATAQKLPHIEAQSDSATPENLPFTKTPTDSDTPEGLLLNKIQSDSATPENLPLLQSQSQSASTPLKKPLLQGLTSVLPPDNLRQPDSQSDSTSPEKFPLHQSLLARLSSAPIGTSTQNLSSSGSGAEKISLLPYQPPLPLGISLSQLSGKRSTPRPSPDDEDSSKAARSPPSWIAHTQRTGSNHSQTGSQPKRRMFVSPSKQSWVHSDGSAFSYKYQPSVQDICALGQFTVPAEMIQWSVRYLLEPSPQTSTDQQGQASGAQNL